MSVSILSAYFVHADSVNFPPFWKRAFTRLTVGPFVICIIVIFKFQFGFKGRILVLMSPVPDPEFIKLFLC